MKASHLRPLVVLPLCLLSACQLFGGSSAVNLHGGTRDLNSNTAGISEQSVYGLEAVVGVGGGGWALEAQGFKSEGDGKDASGFDTNVATSELAAGVRYTFLRKLPVRPYVGLGGNWMDAELTSSGSAAQTDDGFGGYAHAGVLASILAFQAGIDLRSGLSGAEVGGESQDYVQGTIFIGLTW